MATKTSASNPRLISPATQIALAFTSLSIVIARE
jgi:hypothetical protein